MIGREPSFPDFHQLDEVLAVLDIITVMKDGQKVMTERALFLTADTVPAAMKRFNPSYGMSFKTVVT